MNLPISKSLQNCLLIALLFFSAQLQAQQIKEPQHNPAKWSQPYPPFRIVGNIYYVGTYDLACYLITTPDGHFLINTGLANSAKLIEQSIKTLGFKLSDVKVLLTTQAHFDHMGAMAEIQRKTHAKVMVNEADAQVMEDGGSSDYALGNGSPSYEPVKPDRRLKDQEEIHMGGTTLTMLNHPGHTKGSCSYLLAVKDKQKTYRVLIANMPTIVTSKKFTEVHDYPNIEQDYAATIKKMKSLKFDIWLASHASQFELHQKHQTNSNYFPQAFVDPKGYQREMSTLEQEFQKKIKR